MNITDEQRELLKKYGVEVLDDVDDTPLALDDKITEVGFNADYSLNEKGQELQKCMMSSMRQTKPPTIS